MSLPTAQCRRACRKSHNPAKICEHLEIRDREQHTNAIISYKVFHGKTGVVYNVTKSAVGVILYKQVGNRYIEKRVNVRIEHVRLSRSREEFLNRVKENAAKKRKAKEEGTSLQLKRQAVKPREPRTVSAKDNKPESIAPIAYETTI